MRTLTEEQYVFLQKQVDEYNEEKYGYIHIAYEDIVHTYFVRDEILNDFFEWESNDKYTNEKWKYCCSEYRFIYELCEKLDLFSENK